MRRHLLLLPMLAGLVAGGLLGPASGEAATGMDRDSCVECHKDARFLVTNRKLYDYYRLWSESLHAQEGVSCADCHGGHPDKTDKQAAHGGDLSGANPSSAVHFSNIPRTCGEQCHGAIYDAFRESDHYEHLVEAAEEQQGPSCVTCHGSVEVEVLRVTTVSRSCARCHNAETKSHPENPERAGAILNKLLSIHRYYRYITARDTSGSREFFEALSHLMDELAVAWHTFDLDEVEQRTQVVFDLMKAKRNELRALQRQEEASR